MLTACARSLLVTQLPPVPVVFELARAAWATARSALALRFVGTNPAGAGGRAPEEFIERSETDAAVFLTVYPSYGLTNITSDDFTILGNQILNYTQNYNRSVFLR